MTNRKKLDVVNVGLKAEFQYMELKAPDLPDEIAPEFQKYIRVLWQMQDDFNPILGRLYRRVLAGKIRADEDVDSFLALEAESLIAENPGKYGDALREFDENIRAKTQPLREVIDSIKSAGDRDGALQMLAVWKKFNREFSRRQAGEKEQTTIAPLLQKEFSSLYGLFKE